MSDIAAFLTAQLDEREAIALAAQGTTRGIWTQVDPDREPGRIEDDYGDVVTYDEGGPDEAQGRHIAANDPAHVLADIAAKRRRLERHQPEVTEHYARDGGIVTFTACEVCGNGGTTDDAWPCVELLDDAAPYAGQPGFDESWRP